jgi:putative phosphoesterase
MNMRIGLITDTHIAWEEKEIPAKVAEIFNGVDLILHAGDIYTHSVLDDLEKIAPVYAALGDDDYTSSDPRIKDKHLLELEGHRLCLIHEGPYSPLSEYKLTRWWENTVTPEEAEFGKPDIIVSGHEHKTRIERCDGILCINSGSPNLLHYKRGPGTVGILELNNGTAEARIIRL